ncbi:MAG: UDP-N-acetylglucosamine 2-epimerase (non-hydrolyzing), partial [Bdellovibrionaceae bacterium]|nr:UDP-N-acetylglucosamine 2-epimerase (non-hydrolyzing) [Pseudobdellovibrionaceae bacterium]
VFFKELNIPKPKYCLDIHGLDHGEMTGRMLMGVEKILKAEKPDWVLVYGDTNSTLAGALAAAKMHIPIAHVEAGLRSFNRKMPEEINRVLVDHVSEVLFAPTPLGRDNLLSEGIPAERIHIVGDVMYDVSLNFGKLADQKAQLLKSLGLEAERYVLLTCHRQENTDDPDRLKAIILGMENVAAKYSVVFPIHPRTKKLLLGLDWFKEVKELRLIDPVGYVDMVALEKNAALIATDSGGVQKEAFFYKVPCVTLRDETEWGELVQSGWNKLLPPRSAKEVEEGVFASIGCGGSVLDAYGRGTSAAEIVEIMMGLRSVRRD